MTTQKMLSLLRKGISTHKMIKDGDKIAVGVSGGKDSVSLLKLLAEYKKFSPEKFDLIAITVDLAFENANTDFSAIKALCEELSVEYFIEKTEIGKIVFDVRKESNPCALCSRMRKGALNSLATLKGCNKVALGHHSDDLIETMFLSLFYEGRLSTFAPKSFLDKSNLTLIRPMIYAPENFVIGFAKKYELPIVKNRCPEDKRTKREYAKNLIKQLEKENPGFKTRLFTAIEGSHAGNFGIFPE